MLIEISKQKKTKSLIFSSSFQGNYFGSHLKHLKATLKKRENIIIQKLAGTLWRAIANYYIHLPFHRCFRSRVWCSSVALQLQYKFVCLRNPQINSTCTCEQIYGNFDIQDERPKKKGESWTLRAECMVESFLTKKGCIDRPER